MILIIILVFFIFLLMYFRVFINDIESFDVTHNIFDFSYRNQATLENTTFHEKERDKFYLYSKAYLDDIFSQRIETPSDVFPSRGSAAKNGSTGCK